jgi:acid phosphatase family membrane protein YuiD
MIARFFLLLVLLAFLALAIMFDWFGMRELAHNGIEHLQNLVFKLSEAGDWLTNSSETVKKTIDSANGQ